MRWLAYGWLAVALVILGLSSVYKSLNERMYNPRLGINLVVIGERQMGILVLRPNENIASYTLLPENLMIKDENGSKYRIGSLWGLGALEHKAGEKVMVSLGRAMGLKISAFVKTGSDAMLDVNNLPEEIAIWKLNNNLNWWDKIDLNRDIRYWLQKGELVGEELPKNLTNEEVEPDGVRSLLPDEGKLNAFATRIWVNSTVLAERVNMAVFNNSETAGKARDLAKSLSVMGVKVVVVEKGGDSSQKCRFLVYRKNIPVTIEVLERIYGCKLGGIKPMYGDSRVDIELVTGTN